MLRVLRHLNLTLILPDYVSHMRRCRDNNAEVTYRVTQMALKVGSVFLGHVKVELQSRSPKLWGWKVRMDGSDAIVEGSERLFSHAEDAWREGQRALASLEAQRISH
jgi:hypothetical protein